MTDKPNPDTQLQSTETKSVRTKDVFGTHLVAAVWPVHVFFLAAITTNAYFGSVWWVAYLAPTLLTFAWLSLAFIRVGIERDKIRVRFGLFGPAISMQSISKIQVSTYKPRDFGGWWVRRHKGRELYALPGDKGNVVVLTYLDANNDENSLFIGSKRALALGERILSARQQAGATAGTALSESVPS